MTHVYVYVLSIWFTTYNKEIVVKEVYSVYTRKWSSALCSILKKHIYNSVSQRYIDCLNMNYIFPMVSNRVRHYYGRNTSNLKQSHFIATHLS